MAKYQKKQTVVDMSPKQSLAKASDDTAQPDRPGKRIVVGMSGGVDSSIALVLLKEQGWAPVGVSLKYAVWRDKANLLRENICCSSESFKIAEIICKKLGVPYHIVDVAEAFKKEVIDYFVSELKKSKTPNPCIICNRYLKFRELFNWAKKHKIAYVATGHYARVRKNTTTGQHELLMARDKQKDQTYSLCFLPQKWLKHIVFPLGDYTKQQVFRLAQKHGFKFFLKRKQSQDFCFVAGKALGRFLEKEIGKREGIIKDVQGKILGKHPGLHFYTIGQRKGLKLPGGPYFVQNYDLAENCLIVTRRRKEVVQKAATLSPFHFIGGNPPKTKTRVMVKVRYRQPLVPATLYFAPRRINAKNKLKILFDKPQKAVTPGQFAVFYRKNVCLGGGRINDIPIECGTHANNIRCP